MRILANENVAGDVVDLLRGRGHDVVWIRVEAPGSSDETILSLAVGEQRLLVTFDKDFGELVFKGGCKASCGVVLFRIEAFSSAALASKVADALESRTDWAGHFSVVDEQQIRIVPLPGVE